MVCSVRVGYRFLQVSPILALRSMTRARIFICFRRAAIFSPVWPAPTIIAIHLNECNGLRAEWDSQHTDQDVWFSLYFLHPVLKLRLHIPSCACEIVPQRHRRDFFVTSEVGQVHEE